MKKSTNYDQNLHLFVGKEQEFRAWMQKPFLIDDYAYATNGHMMVRCKKDKVSSEIKELSKEDNIQHSLAIETCFGFEQNTELVIPIEALQKAILSYPTIEDFDYVGEDIYCPTCDGDGEVEWKFNKYKQDFHCPVCGGSGYEKKKEKKPNGKTKYDINHAIQIGNSGFDANLLEIICRLAAITHEQNLKMIYQQFYNRGSIFLLGDFEIYLMPLFPFEEEKVVEKF